MANIKAALGGTTVITCVLTSVGSYASRESTVVDNTTNLYTDAQVLCQIQMSAIPNGDIWVTLDSGVTGTFAYPATGADAAITIPQMDKFAGEVQGQQHAGTDLLVVGKITCPSSLTATGTVIANLGSMAQVYSGGNQLPPKWGPVFSNCTGSALGATVGNHIIWYDGNFFTSV